MNRGEEVEPLLSKAAKSESLKAAVIHGKQTLWPFDLDEKEGRPLLTAFISSSSNLLEKIV